MKNLAWKDARECGVGTLACRVETSGLRIGARHLDAWTSREHSVGMPGTSGTDPQTGDPQTGSAYATSEALEP